jgi:hypothetical protein
MPWLFKRRVRLMPGLTLNLGKRNVSLSVGRRGMHYTTGTRGSRFTAGLTGTGLYHTTIVSHARQAAQPGFQAAPLSRIQLRGKGFWRWLIPGPPVQKVVDQVEARRGDIFALDKVSDRSQRLRAMDTQTVALWDAARVDILEVMRARGAAKHANDAIINAYRGRFADLRASAKHVADEEHDAILGKHGPRPTLEAAQSLGDALHQIDVFLHKLTNPGHDPDALVRDLNYTLQSVEARYGYFVRRMRTVDPAFEGANPNAKFDF